MDNRYYWADVLSELRRTLIRTEERSQKELKLATPDTGIWIETFLTVAASQQYAMSSMAMPGGVPGITPPPGMGGVGVVDEGTRRRFESDQAPPNPYGNPPAGTLPSGYSSYGGPPNPYGQPPQPGATPGVVDPNAVPELAMMSTNHISTFRILCRAVDRTTIQADANSTIVTIFESELRASPLFDPSGTRVISNINLDGTTFTVSLVVTLKDPLKL